jgi:hypothetical protein
MLCNNFLLGWVLKKILKILMPLLLICAFFTLILVKGNYQQSPGQTYTYDIITADLDLIYNGSSTSGSGFVLDGTKYNDGTQIEVYVLTVDPSVSVNYDVSIGADSEVFVSNLINDVFWLATVLIYPIFVSDGFGIVGDWVTIQSIVAEGLGLIMAPFWDTAYIGVFEEMTLQENIADLKTAEGMEDLTIKGKYSEKGGNAIFDWMLKGSTTYTGMYTYDFDVEHQLKLVYSMSTGVLQGIKMLSAAVGTHSGASLDLSLEYLQEIDGYDMDDFAIGLPGFGWIITFGTLGILVIPLIKRRYQNK